MSLIEDAFGVTSNRLCVSPPVVWHALLSMPSVSYHRATTHRREINFVAERAGGVMGWKRRTNVCWDADKLTTAFNETLGVQDIVGEGGGLRCT